MSRTFFKTAFRNIFRNKTTTLINLFGLSVALAAFVFIALWVQNELSFDDFHTDAKDIFLAEWEYLPSNSVSPITPLPIGDALRKDRDVQFAATMGRWPGTLNVDGDLYDEKAGIAVDSNWFKIFDYTVLSGNIQSFNSNPFSIIFTQSKARQLFGSKDPIGRVIRLDTTLYEVRAIVKDNPINSSLQFDMLVPLAARLAFRQGDINNWGNASYRTFVKVYPHTNIPSFCNNVTALMGQMSAKKEFALVVQPLHELHFDTNSMDSAFRRGSHTAVFVFSILGLLLLISASINYVNLTITEANVRTKEISIRKIIGGNSRQLFLQFLMESFLLCLIALILCFFIIWLTLPLFDRLTETNFRLSAGSGVLWFLLAVTLFISTIMNGVFPAVIMAFFKPLDFLHGHTILRLRNILLRKGLVVFQFTIGIIFVIVTIVIFRQMQLAQSSAAQYNRAQVVAFELPSQKLQKLGYDQQKINLFSQTFGNDLRGRSGIQGIVFASSPFEGPINSKGVLSWYWNGMDTSIKASVKNIVINPGAENIFNLQIEEGRWFQADGSDKRNFILNETAVKEFGLRQPVIGQLFARRGQDTGTIIGVIKDYNFSSLYNKIDPLVIGDDDQEFKPDFFIKIAPGSIPKTMDAIAASWKKYIPEAPFQYQFTDQAFDNLYKDDLKISKLVFLFSCISIMISVLGLFSLTAFVCEQRRKEIGIRKVMGAAVTQITAMLSREFLILVFIAVVIAIPVGYWATSKWLQNFAYKIEIRSWDFVIAGSMVLLIALATVSFHAFRAAIANPVDALRNE